MTRTLVGAAEPDEPQRRPIVVTSTWTGTTTTTPLPIKTTGATSQVIYLELTQTQH